MGSFDTLGLFWHFWAPFGHKTVPNVTQNVNLMRHNLLQVMMVKKMQETDTENEIREAYRVFDKERTGQIAVSEMRHILSNLPEKLSHEEIDEMLRTADKVIFIVNHRKYSAGLA